MPDPDAHARSFRRHAGAWLPVTALGLALTSLALGAATTTGPVASLDTSALLAGATLRHTTIGTALDVYQVLGELVPFLALLGIPTALLVARRRFRSAALVASGFAASLVSGAVKLVFATARPPGGELVDVLGELSFAYPSGHTTRALVAFGLIGLALLRERRPGSRVQAGAVAAGVAALTIAMGAARVVSGEHWLSDVVGGALLGGAWVALAAWLWPPRADA